MSAGSSCGSYVLRVLHRQRCVFCRQGGEEGTVRSSLKLHSHASNWFATAVVAAHLADSQLNARQAYPQENVGVFVQRGRGGPLSVVEYSEMDAAMTTEINQSTGRLRYCWSNVWFLSSTCRSLPPYLPPSKL
jgi:hypothetical protein